MLFFKETFTENFLIRNASPKPKQKGNLQVAETFSQTRTS